MKKIFVSRTWKNKQTVSMLDPFLYGILQSYGMAWVLTLHDLFCFFGLLKSPIDVTTIFILHWDTNIR